MRVPFFRLTKFNFYLPARSRIANLIRVRAKSQNHLERRGGLHTKNCAVAAVNARDSEGGERVYALVRRITPFGFGLEYIIDSCFPLFLPLQFSEYLIILGFLSFEYQSTRL